MMQKEGAGAQLTWQIRTPLKNGIGQGVTHEFYYWNWGPSGPRSVKEGGPYCLFLMLAFPKAYFYMSAYNQSRF